MIFNQTSYRIILRVVLLLLSCCIGAWFISLGRYLLLVPLMPLLIYQVFDLIRLNNRSRRELELFIETIHYRDFSRHFDVKNASEDILQLRKGFNTIIETFKSIAREKETQYQYLQKILELVDTGILSYQEDNGEVVWMNESLRKMLQVPYLKTIHSLKKRDEVLYESIMELSPGSSRVGLAHKDGSPFKVLLSATGFRIDQTAYKLIAFQNVNEALEETESEAWQKLLRVLTHEIMNSVAPIASLAQTLQTRLGGPGTPPDQGEVALEDLRVGVDTIRKRSEGLLKFASTYRNLNKINSLNRQLIYARDLVENIMQLMQPSMEQKHIEIETILKDPDQQLMVDPSLVEQVLINLLVNASEAVKDTDHPRIVLSAGTDPDLHPIIRVTDNGPGIPSELMERIFIPFFSTKKNGSGIGLSLCKQIMLLHKGRIQVSSVPGEGSSFTLTF